MDLNSGSLKQFIKLCISGASERKIEICTGIPKDKVRFYKDMYSITDASSARDALSRLFPKQDRLQLPHEKEVERLKDAQKRLDDLNSSCKIGKPKPFTKEDADRQREIKNRFENMSTPAYNSGDWTLPDDITPERFRHMIASRGFRFTMNMLDVSAEQIVKEANRLRLKINWDMVKR